ncbi:probable inactive leucine-rich repeat receptor-like protein kinase At3g03770 isoform X1 [Nicotiana tomentosiformis]|uniref:probable inactive leucine-rich repeat receptor-like protein kinase At3g03770 isoform X1 n=1 Tax=Nicotiana tomentosiformis TaxID=4098 RepID=UPI00051B53C2|nr:probable inactive leucine-rich repeat receptor-like protein kinase At3g03770 isoform X1 [Nicotiana tomentosiformis]
MGFLKFFVIVLVIWGFFIANSYQLLQSYETQALLQLRKHLEYPIQLDVWENYNGDFCSLTSTLHMSITCQDNSVTELKIKGDKLVKLNEFHGFAVPNQTLSEVFSIDSFVTTLTRLNSLKVLTLVSLGIWGPLPDKIHRLSSLELLDMSSNFLFGSVPFQMSRLIKLHTLTFDGNFFNDTVPNWLDSLTNLTILSLKNNRLKGQFPISVSKITTLTVIVLSHNVISGKLPDLTALSKLLLLDLRENHLDSELPPLPKGVTTVLLSSNAFSGEIPVEFGTLNQLQHLDLSNNSLDGMPPADLFSLPNISYLNLASNVLSGSLPDHLSCGGELGFVDISDNRLVGRLPSCLNTISDKRIVKVGGNCLSLETQYQHSEGYCKQAKKHIKGQEIALLAGVILGIAIVVVFLLVGFLIFCRRKNERNTVDQHIFPKVVQRNTQPGIPSEFLANTRIISHAANLGSQGASSYRVFSMEELLEATENFDQSALLGEGSIGKIYKGRLENGAYIAVRSLNVYRRYSNRNLKLRLDLLSKFRHPHLVSLLGHCIDGGAQDDSAVPRIFLIYEYISNGNFRAHLSETSPRKVLKWSDRLSVLIGVAKAVHFLHTGVIPSSFSNRLKTSNILLDEHNMAKLSDYGMSILMEETEKAKGDDFTSWRMTKKEDDVYNFGFILLESLVGPTVSGKGEAFLLNEMQASFGSQDGRRRIMDPVVLTTSSQESLSIVISITNKCISPESSNRPSFEDVLWNLQYAAQVQATSDTDQKSGPTSPS